jgi:hypothetical protein
MSNVENQLTTDLRGKATAFLRKHFLRKKAKKFAGRQAGRGGCVRTPCRVERVESLGKSDATTAFNRILTDFLIIESNSVVPITREVPDRICAAFTAGGWAFATWLERRRTPRCHSRNRRLG